MKYLRKIVRLLSTLSYVIIIIYSLVHVPEFFGLHKMIIVEDNDNYIYSKGSIVYYYETDTKNIGAGDIITFKKQDKILSGSITGISGSEFKVKTGSSEERVSSSNIMGKNINIVVRFLGPFIILISNNLIISLIVLLGFIILNIILKILYKNKVKKEENKEETVIVNDNPIITEQVNVNENNSSQKEHKKVLEIDE